jgi:SAM-dependent methyltransferase
MALRGMALATAIMRAHGQYPSFVHFMACHPLARVLEINEADGLHRYLRRMPRHRLVVHPDVDMMDLPFPDAAFDVVVHSDTLEHVVDPVRGLSETKRVLRRGGVACYTVPVLVGRLTRRRDDLPPSYHGTEASPSFLVHTEYGADAWTEPIRAGFTSCEVVALGYPAGIALVARP